MVLKYPSSRDIIKLHQLILKNSGGSPGILSEDNLELCVEKPKTKVFGYDPYPSLHEKAASVFHDMNKLHPFVDGNKRTAYETTKLFLILNGLRMMARKEDVIQVSLQTAECSKNMVELTSWIRENTIRAQ